MRKIKSLLLIAFAVVLLGSAQVKAANEVVAIDGASIRTATEELGQGLRFYAKLDESVKENEHGFYIAYGIATPAELEAAIALAAGGDVMLNGKVVYQTVVPGVTAENEYSVVLLGIPEVGYFDAITVLPYVVIDEDIVLPEVVVTRSVGEVALNMASAGENPPEAVLNAVKTSYKRVGLNAKGQLEITDDLYELNHFKLGEEFAKDWNSKFGTTWTKIVGTTFHANAAIGAAGASNAGTDLSGSNLYKFFHDEAFGPKWGWVLEFIKTSNGVHPNKQITAVQGDGTDGTNILYHASHLNFSIANFFNQANDTGGYAPINYNSIAKYDNLANFNNKVYVNVANYTYLPATANYVMPAAAAIAGYNFVNYKVGEVEVDAGASVALTSNATYDIVYQIINYNIKYYDGETELTDLAQTYNVEAAATLPVPEIAGKVFEGWYANPDFSGDAVTSVVIGSTGEKVFYGKFEETTNIPVEVTYQLNGGRLTAEQMIEHRTATKIIATRYSTAGDSVGNNITIGPSRGGLYWYVMGFKATAVEGVYELVGKDAGYTNAEATLYISYHDSVTDPGAATLKSLYNSIAVGHLVVVPWLPPAVTGSTSVDMHFMPVAAATDNVVTTLTIAGPLMVPAGTNFLGWYDNASFTGSPIVDFPGYVAEDGVTAITYYAKWE